MTMRCLYCNNPTRSIPMFVRKGEGVIDFGHATCAPCWIRHDLQIEPRPKLHIVKGGGA